MVQPDLRIAPNIAPRSSSTRMPLAPNSAQRAKHEVQAPAPFAESIGQNDATGRCHVRASERYQTSTPRARSTKASVTYGMYLAFGENDQSGDL